MTATSTSRSRRASSGSAAQREVPPRSPRARSAAGATATRHSVRPARGAGTQPEPARTGPAGRRPAAQPAGARAAAAARQRHVRRNPFVLLVIGLLGGGLVCLLVINTTLAAGSVQISRLQQANAAETQQVQQLQQQVTAEQSPAWLQRQALLLGMKPQPVLNFVDIGDGRRYSTAAHLPPLYNVPGYTP